MDDTTRTGDWKGKEWAGEDVVPATDNPPAETWNKEQYAGDHGSGLPEPQDPDTMPEGETSISGNRHSSGESHWAPDERRDTTPTPR